MKINLYLVLYLMLKLSIVFSILPKVKKEGTLTEEELYDIKANGLIDL